MLTRREFLALSATAAAGLALPQLTRAADPGPPWPTDDWLTANPEDHGLNPDILGRIHDFAPTTRPPANGFVVARDGFIVYEEYFRDFDQTSFHSVNSVTKS